MAFTAQELQNIANAALDFHMDRGKVHSQTIQSKPLLRTLKGVQKTFPGGKELITVRVKGDYTTTIEGYSHNDTVSYQNPANIKTASYPWKEIHAGIEVTYTELKKDGITVVDSLDGTGENRHSRREMTALAGLLDDKLEDMSEGYARGFQDMYWQDGTQDASLVPGVRSFILNDPTSAVTVGGLDQAALTWWRNRAVLAINVSDPSNQNIANTLQKEFRQLRRYNSPNHRMFAGSDWLEATEKELRANGSYTDAGWSNKGGIDLAMDSARFKGAGTIEYDPTLDDLGLAKYLYVIDTKCIYPMVMEGEEDKRHSPARPEDKYVLYRAMTWTGGLVCKGRNTSGVYSIA